MRVNGIIPFRIYESETARNMKNSAKTRKNSQVQMPCSEAQQTGRSSVLQGQDRGYLIRMAVQSNA
jgi:hypothetical protein